MGPLRRTPILFNVKIGRQWRHLSHYNVKMVNGSPGAPPILLHVKIGRQRRNLSDFNVKIDHQRRHICPTFQAGQTAGHVIQVLVQGSVNIH